MSDASNTTDADASILDDADGRARGGFARAQSLTPEERREIAREAANRRWAATRQIEESGEKIHQATHAGELVIGDTAIACAVLDDPAHTRVISRNAIFRAFGRSKRGRAKDETRVPNMPSFIDARNLQPLVSKYIEGGPKLVAYRDLKGRVMAGYNAVLLPQLCDVYLQGRRDKVLTKPQEKLALAAEFLARSLSKVGIIALVDEATGYQEVRDRRALEEILDRYLRKEFAAWAKCFPDEFYQQIFRLRSWQWKGMSVRRPGAVAQYTKDLVYKRIAPGLLKELETRNPVTEKGYRKTKHHQWLTEDIGHPALAQHIYALMGLMRACKTWEQFYEMVQRAFPKKGETLSFDFEEPL